jgi:hypothetical protein
LVPPQFRNTGDRQGKVVTWQAPNGETINLTRQQERQLRAGGTWPRNSRGEEYCQVSHGLHIGEPDEFWFQ